MVPSYLGVVQGRSRLRLTLEASQSLSVFGNLVGQEFQGDKAMQPHVLGFVDDTHSAAELLQDAVMRNGLTDKLGGSRHWRKW
jgi:hypothetical protein